MSEALSMDPHSLNDSPQLSSTGNVELLQLPDNYNPSKWVVIK